MPSIADEAMNRLVENVKSGPRDLIRDLETTARVIDGIIAMFSLDKSKKATDKDIMRSTGRMYERALKKNRTYKGTVISIKKLRENAVNDHSHIEQLSEPITDDLMKYYKEHCKKAGVQYSILKEHTRGRKDNYYVFFKSNDAALVKGCIERGMKDYAEHMKNPENNKNRDSVLHKLDSFIKIVKTRDTESPAKERHQRHAEPSR